MAPEGPTLEESNRNLDEITDLALELQKQTGVKVLWVTCNLFAHPRSVTVTANTIKNLILNLPLNGTVTQQCSCLIGRDF